MSITLRNNKWQAYVTNKGKRYRKSFTSHNEAQLWEAQVRLAITHNLPVPTEQRDTERINKWTLQTTIRAVENLYWKGSKSELNLMPQAWGVTTMYSNGMQHIELDPILAGNPHLKSAVILHEFTHVYLNAQGKTDAGHGREFVMTCIKLAKLSGLPRLACQEKL